MLSPKKLSIIQCRYLSKEGESDREKIDDYSLASKI